MERDASGIGPLISGIVAGGFRVDDGVYPALLITPSRADQWTPPPIEQLTEHDFGAALSGAHPPEFILLGTGAKLRRPPASLVAALDARGIGIEPMDSRAAARAWGVLRAEMRAIVGALYPLD